MMDDRCFWWLVCVQDYDENDQDVDTETYPVNVIDHQHHSLIDGEETERTTLLGQSMLASRPPGKLLLLSLGITRSLPPKCLSLCCSCFCTFSVIPPKLIPVH